MQKYVRGPKFFWMLPYPRSPPILVQNVVFGKLVPTIAFDQWCLRRILRFPYTAHVTNEEVRRRTGQPPVTSTIVSRRLRLFGRADPSQDHSRALQAAINRLPTDWRRQRGRPRRTWLRTIESDLQPTNLGLNSAWLAPNGVQLWRRLCSPLIVPPDDDDDDESQTQFVYQL